MLSSQIGQRRMSVCVFVSVCAANESDDVTLDSMLYLEPDCTVDKRFKTIKTNK